MEQKKKVQSESDKEKAQMNAFLTRSDERRVRLQAEKKELLKVSKDQNRIKDSLISRLEALKLREANQIE